MLARLMPSPRSYKIEPFIKINRTVGTGTFYFGDVFQGFQDLEAVRQIFGKKTRELLSKLKVEVFPRQGYMGVSDEDGHIFASQFYINEGELWSVYLDTVHELVHVRQFLEGRNLFDPAYDYVDRPTEIEAYQIGAKEARRIGLTEQEIFEYLEVPWITNAQHMRLAARCDIPIDRVTKEKSLKSKAIGRKK